MIGQTAGKGIVRIKSGIQLFIHQTNSKLEEKLSNKKLDNRKIHHAAKGNGS
jgi:hypothetical protein